MSQISGPNATWESRFNAAQPITDKQLEPDGSITTLSGQTISGPNASLARRYAQAAPIPDKWVNSNGSITSGNASGGGGGGGEMNYPAAGIGVSTGSGWAASLDPDNSFLKLTGGTMSGQLNFVGTSAFISQYNGALAFRGITGVQCWTSFTMAGPGYVLTLGRNPVNDMEAATKQYVDNTVPQVIQVADEATALSQSQANPNNFYFWV